MSNPVDRCISAGFVRISQEESGDVKIHCHGESESLNISSGLEVDDELLGAQLGIARFNNP